MSTLAMPVGGRYARGVEWVKTGGPKKKIKDMWEAWKEILHKACPPDAFEKYIKGRTERYSE